MREPQYGRDQALDGLTINFADGSTKVLEFNSNDPIMVGSGASAHVRIEGDDVSSLHCMIKPKDGGKVAVLDLGSDEGTELNGKELKGETDVNDGDNVTVGKAKIRCTSVATSSRPTVPIRRATGHEVVNPETTRRTPSAAALAAVPAKPAAVGVTTAELPAAAEARGRADKKQIRPRSCASARQERSRSDDRQGPAVVEETPRRPRPRSPPPCPPRREGQRRARGTARRAHGDVDGAAHRAARDVESRASSSARSPPTRTARCPRAAARPRSSAPSSSPEEKPQNKGHVDVTALWGGTVFGVQRVAGAGAVHDRAGRGQQLPDRAPVDPVAELRARHAERRGRARERRVRDGGDRRRQERQRQRSRSRSARSARCASARSSSWCSTRSATRPSTSGCSRRSTSSTRRSSRSRSSRSSASCSRSSSAPKFASLDDDDLFKNQQEFTK